MLLDFTEILNQLPECSEHAKMLLALLQNYVSGFTENEDQSLDFIRVNLENYSLRSIKGMYLYSTKDDFTIKKLFSKDIVVKKEKLDSLLQLAQEGLSNIINESKLTKIDHGASFCASLLSEVNERLIKINSN